MKAEIISIGTELLLGHVVNSDAAIIGRELAALGLDVVNMQTVGDNPERLLDALSLAASRADIIITSGGLGPTDDDLTKTTVARFTGRELVQSQEALAMLREYFGSRLITPNQMNQALFPAGATILPNNVGTAPGCAVPFGENGFIILLPGPPSELTRMLEEAVRPFLLSLSDSVIHSINIRTFGIGEGAAASLISDLMQSANPTVAPYASRGEMFVRVTAKARTAEQAKHLAEPVIADIRRRLGDVIYGTDVDSLEEAVVRRLLAGRTSIATAESCTGGLLAKRITDVPGASEIFQLGLVTYSNQAKTDLLGISSLLLSEVGAVSPEVARAMAASVRKLAKSDIGIGITGIAGPFGGTPQKPVGLVYIALDCEKGCYLHKLEPLGRYLGREWVRERASGIALDMVRRLLDGLPVY